MRSSLSPEYLAGFFDGEGCISLSAGDLYTLHVSVTQVNPAPLREFAAAFGGNVRLRRWHRPDQRPGYIWNIASQKAMAMLKVLRPYLIVKAEEADIAIAFQSLRRPGRVPLRDWPAKKETYAVAAAQLKALKHRVWPEVAE